MKSLLKVSDFSVDILWNIGSLIFLASSGLIMNGIIVATSGVEALGIFNQVYAFYVILSQIGTGGIQLSVLKHISYVKDDIAQCADIAVNALILVIIISLPIVTIGMLSAESIGNLLSSPDVGLGLLYVMPGLLFFAANKVLINVLNGVSRMRVYAVFRALRFIFIPLFIIIILLLQQAVYVLPLALTLAELVLFILLMGYIFRYVLPLKPIEQFRYYTGQHLSYGVRGLFSGVLIEMNTRIDVLMLGFFFSDSTVGLYSFAAILAEGFAQIPIAVRYNVDPLIGQYFSTKTEEQIVSLAQKIRRIFVPVMLILGVISTLAYPIVFLILSGSEGLALSWAVFTLLAFANVVVAAYSPLRGILLQGGAPGHYTLIILATVSSNILLNAVFISQIGVLGAALATGSIIILEIVLIVLSARRLFDIRL